MAKELEGLEEGSKVEIHIDLHRTTLKNIKLESTRPQWNTWILVQEILLHSWQTSTQNKQMPTRSTSTQMDGQRKDHIDPERPPLRNHPKQLQTHNLPTYDVENINSTYKGTDLSLTTNPWIVPWGTERMLQRILRHKRATLHKSVHPQQE